jgi:hypothetical protein
MDPETPADRLRRTAFQPGRARARRVGSRTRGVCLGRWLRSDTCGERAPRSVSSHEEDAECALEVEVDRVERSGFVACGEGVDDLPVFLANDRLPADASE